GNYPHHARRLADILGVAPDAASDDVARAIARWDAAALEDRAAETGAIVGAVREPAAWDAHPEGVCVSRDPIAVLRREQGAVGHEPWRSGAAAPLDGIRVLDLTRVLAGPIAARDLAFAGADVLRVDSPRLPEIEAQHLETGHGKRSALLDLADPTDRRTFDGLLATADVVLTGYRPGSLDRHGLSPDALRERRPGLVVGAVGAWSEHGPWAQRRGFDSIVQAVTGIAMRESPDGLRPGALPAQALDHSAGHLLAAGVCLALVERSRDGGGAFVRLGLARLAHELLGSPSAGHETDAARASVPTLQTGRTPAGDITTPLPPFTYPGGPSDYPALAGPWGRDAPAWR
ncbi:MAG: CoA transferase, partial [Microbacterium sp.]